MRVLLGIGDDEQSSVALDRTIERVRETGDDLTVAVYGGGEHTRESIASDARDRLAEAGLDARVRPVEGEPGPALVSLAEREEFDRLVIPGGSESPMGKVTFDMATEFVLLNCRTTVTLVR